jgi:hypothetical protein
MGTAQKAAIAQLFRVPATSVTAFRWGRSVAPVGNPKAGSCWYTIEYGDVTYQGTATIVVNAQGVVIERTKK